MEDLKAHAEEKKAQIRKKAGKWDKVTVDRVAIDLERYGYDPGIFFPVPDFPSYGIDDIESELDRIVDMDKEEVESFSLSQDRSIDEVKRIAIDMLSAQFFLLERLRAGDPEAWDEIHELYEDD